MISSLFLETHLKIILLHAASVLLRIDVQSPPPICFIDGTLQFDFQFFSFILLLNFYNLYVSAQFYCLTIYLIFFSRIEQALFCSFLVDKTRAISVSCLNRHLTSMPLLLFLLSFVSVFDANVILFFLSQFPSSLCAEHLEYKKRQSYHRMNALNRKSFLRHLFSLDFPRCSLHCFIVFVEIIKSLCTL